MSQYGLPAFSFIVLTFFTSRPLPSRHTAIANEFIVLHVADTSVEAVVRWADGFRFLAGDVEAWKEDMNDFSGNYLQTSLSLVNRVAAVPVETWKGA